MRHFRFAAPALLLAACASAPASAPARPAFVDALIAGFESEPVANPPASVWRYRFEGRTVYYVPPRCCDIPSALYADDGTKVCEPDGGFSGRGDGKCPTFHATRSDEARVWVDPRER